MSFVLDASIAGAWLLPDETSVIAEAALARLEVENAVVPDLFPHEVLNLLLSAERRGRLGIDELRGGVRRLESFRLQTVKTPDPDLVIALSRKHKLSGYDATYLAIAKQLHVPLATLDRHLLIAARNEDVEILGASASS